VQLSTQVPGWACAPWVLFGSPLRFIAPAVRWWDLADGAERTNPSGLSIYTLTIKKKTLRIADYCATFPMFFAWLSTIAACPKTLCHEACRLWPAAFKAKGTGCTCLPAADELEARALLCGDLGDGHMVRFSFPISGINLGGNHATVVTLRETGRVPSDPGAAAASPFSLRKQVLRPSSVSQVPVALAADYKAGRGELKRQVLQLELASTTSPPASLQRRPVSPTLAAAAARGFIELGVTSALSVSFARNGCFDHLFLLRFCSSQVIVFCHVPGRCCPHRSCTRAALAQTTTRGFSSQKSRNNRGG